MEDRGCSDGVKIPLLGGGSSVYERQHLEVWGEAPSAWYGAGSPPRKFYLLDLQVPSEWEAFLKRKHTISSWKIDWRLARKKRLMLLRICHLNVQMPIIFLSYLSFTYPSANPVIFLKLWPGWGFPHKFPMSQGVGIFLKYLAHFSNFIITMVNRACIVF